MQSTYGNFSALHEEVRRRQMFSVTHSCPSSAGQSLFLIRVWNISSMLCSRIPACSSTAFTTIPQEYGCYKEMAECSQSSCDDRRGRQPASTLAELNRTVRMIRQLRASERRGEGRSCCLLTTNACCCAGSGCTRLRKANPPSIYLFRRIAYSRHTFINTHRYLYCLMHAHLMAC